MRGDRLNRWMVPLIGVVLPNLPFAFLWLAGVAVPPRAVAPLLYFGVAMLACRSGLTVTLPLYLLVLAFDAARTLSLMFNLELAELLTATRFAVRINIFSEPAYAGMIVGGGLTALLASFGLARLHRLGPPPAMGRPAALACLLAFISTDLWVNGSGKVTTTMAPLLQTGQPVRSAARESGWREALEAPSRPNALLVVVEGLGQAVETDRREALAALLDTEAVRRHYSVTRGSVPNFGSTTAAEMRELCESREAYSDVAQQGGAACLPAQLASKGYQPVAVHAFSGTMFDRVDWYPRVGFAQAYFDETLDGASCGSVFVGRCDVDVADRVSTLLGAAPAGRFVHWLTLNTHIPVDVTAFPECPGRFDQAQVCAMGVLWRRLFARLADLAVAQPGTEILVVGDHPPPFWSRAARQRFEAGVVPWFRLRPLPSS